MYGARLRWVFDPDRLDFTWHDLRVAIKGLPPDGTALARAVHGARARWTDDRYLLAQAVDYIGELVYVTMLVNTDKKKQRQVRKPPRVERPSDLETGRTARERRVDGQHAREVVRDAARRSGPRQQSSHEDVMRFFGKVTDPEGRERDVSVRQGARRLPTVTEVRPEFR